MESMPGTERRAKHAGWVTERIVQGHAAPRLRGKGSRVGSRAEGARDRLIPAEGQQGPAQDGFLGLPGKLDDGAGESGQRIREPVVSVDAGDLLDEIDLPFEVETPARQADRVFALALFFESTAERLEHALGGLRADAAAIFGGAQDAANLAVAEMDGPPERGARGRLGNDNVDQFALRIAAGRRGSVARPEPRPGTVR